MAAQKPTVVFFPAFSTILHSCSIEEFSREIDASIDRTEQNDRFKRIHGMTRNDWDRALSLHLHGDLQ